MDLKKLKERASEKLPELIPHQAILIGFRGSVAHGTFIPTTEPNSTDDIDLIGVYFAPADNYIGIKEVGKGVVERFVGEWDVVSYEFKKLVRLLIKSNPNVMSMLWMEDEFYLKNSKYGKILIDNRDAFTSKLVFNSYTGYASGQLHKMTSHVREGYMGEKRKRLVEKYGFDSRNTSHCIRLLKQGIEFLETGKIKVDRTGIDADELIAIKCGKLSLDEVKEYAESLFADSKIAFAKSQLPEVPDYEKINKIVYHILYEYIS